MYRCTIRFCQCEYPISWFLIHHLEWKLDRIFVCFSS